MCKNAQRLPSAPLWSPLSCTHFRAQDIMTKSSPLPAFLTVIGEGFWVSSANDLSLKLNLNSTSPQPEAFPKPELRVDLESSRFSHFSAGADTSVHDHPHQAVKKLQKSLFLNCVASFVCVSPMHLEASTRNIAQRLSRFEYQKVSMGLTLLAQVKLVCRAR